MLSHMNHTDTNTAIVLEQNNILENLKEQLLFLQEFLDNKLLLSNKLLTKLETTINCISSNIYRTEFIFKGPKKPYFLKNIDPKELTQYNINMKKELVVCKLVRIEIEEFLIQNSKNKDIEEAYDQSHFDQRFNNPKQIIQEVDEIFEHPDLFKLNENDIVKFKKIKKLAENEITAREKDEYQQEQFDTELQELKTKIKNKITK
jgi:hypothetical protein